MIFKNKARKKDAVQDQVFQGAKSFHMQRMLHDPWISKESTWWQHQESIDTTNKRGESKIKMFKWRNMIKTISSLKKVKGNDRLKANTTMKIKWKSAQAREVI